MISVNHLYIFPIKSLSGLSLQTSNTVDGGFEHDRIMMISEPDGTFITAREFPQLLKLRTSVVGNEVSVSLPSLEKICFNLDEFSKNVEPTEVWGNHFTAQIAPIRVNQFFSHFLQKDVQLRWVGSNLTRRIKRYPQTAVSFADGYPYLLLNQASFNYLQQQCPVKLDIQQFRGNIIIDGALPFAEDGWKTIKIGEVLFDIIKPCTRCALTTFNINSTEPLPNNEPLKTLGYFRSNLEGNINFGMNMIARNHGTVSVGDKVEILERQPATRYIKNFPKEQPSNHQSCIITFENTKFEGNNQQTLLEQLEQQSISLPYSCRAGVCGRCSVLLKKGQVKSLTQSGVKQNNTILACSCIPMSDIVIQLLK
ncbi:MULTISPECIES: YcbX family protein [unclassified Gilliamella]|uniref:YcbX family protein n=1 Tax=unclassified Gilliamella TaxID=2685620 RepID=UPI00226A9786|nr:MULTISPECIES: YcbX family protein [unclassified Gilliamella]MCX8665751.1 YcbX family protein [Gilliamella sp. B2887]MCX8699166.1 YcbX family protein [Gilliamella sp. B3000]